MKCLLMSEALHLATRPQPFVSHAATRFVFDMPSSCFTKAIRSYLYNITLILRYINNIQSYLHCALSLKDHEVKVTLNIW